MKFDYDPAGNIRWIKDPLAELYPTERHQVDFTYDDRGNQNGFTDANESTTTYEYDPNFNLTKVIDARSKSTDYDYDELDRLKSITDPLSRKLRYFYDPAGNLNKTAYPNGNETYYDYFKNNLIKSISYKNEATTYDFTYNPTNTLKDVTDNLGKMFSFIYDNGDRLKTSVDQTNPALTDFTVSRAYDPVSNLTGIRAGAETTTTLSYTDRNELSAIDLPDTSGDIALKYDDVGRRRKITGPGATNRFYFDAASRVATATVETGSGTDSYLYTHDSNGNILSVNDTAYAYDVLNRLKSWYDPGSDITTSYSYDAAGNLTTVKENGDTVKSLTYDDANQISSTGYNYDDNGNLIEDPNKWYVYDGDNRLKTVVSKDTSTTIASYAYDFMGRRSSSTDASETATYFHYDGWNVVAETDSTGTVTANYYYDDQGRIMAMKRDGAYYYYQFDAHGDVVSLTDSSGTIVNTYEYDPWGNHLSASEQVANPYRYAGYRWDGDTGLYYLRARYYSPGDYRFLTRDEATSSIVNPQSFNPYAYALNNPVAFIDSSGETAIVAGIVIVVIVAYLAYKVYDLYNKAGAMADVVRGLKAVPTIYNKDVKSAQRSDQVLDGRYRLQKNLKNEAIRKLFTGIEELGPEMIKKGVAP
jgi:RHS repeat-associated protein